MCPSSFLLKCELSKVIFVLVINYSVVVRDTSFIYTCKAHRYTFFLVLSLLVIRDLEDHVETTYWIRYSAVLLISHKNSFGHLNSVLRMCWLSFNATTVRDVRLYSAMTREVLSFYLNFVEIQLIYLTWFLQKHALCMQLAEIADAKYANGDTCAWNGYENCVHVR